MLLIDEIQPVEHEFHSRILGEMRIFATHISASVGIPKTTCRLQELGLLVVIVYVSVWVDVIDGLLIMWLLMSVKRVGTEWW